MVNEKQGDLGFGIRVNIIYSSFRLARNPHNCGVGPPYGGSIPIHSNAKLYQAAALKFILRVCH